MVKITQSMRQFLWQFHRDKLSPVMLGHLEVITKEIFDEYMEWCQTEDGKQYLKGGSKYDAEYARSSEEKKNMRAIKVSEITKKIAEEIKLVSYEREKVDVQNYIAGLQSAMGIIKDFEIVSVPVENCCLVKGTYYWICSKCGFLVDPFLSIQCSFCPGCGSEILQKVK